VTTEQIDHARITALGIYAAVDDFAEHDEWVDTLLDITTLPQIDIPPMTCPAGTFRERS
jgi:hypothetical protein